MSAADQIRAAIVLASERPTRWGSDTCGCDDCAKLRAKMRAEIIITLSRALTELGA